MNSEEEEIKQFDPKPVDDDKILNRRGRPIKQSRPKKVKPTLKIQKIKITVSFD